MTSRATLWYLLPVAPLVAIWSAMKLEEWGVLETPWMARLMKWLALAACAVVLIGLCVAMFLGHEKTGKMPKWMYREVQQIQRETPEYANAKFYFANRAPYSAEFYLRDALKSHALESLPMSVANSSGDFLLAPRQFMPWMKTSRKVLLDHPKWVVLAPESAGDEK